MNRKIPQPLSFGTEGRNPSIITHIKNGRNLSITTTQTPVKILRPSPPPAPPAPPTAKKQ